MILLSFFCSAHIIFWQALLFMQLRQKLEMRLYILQRILVQKFFQVFEKMTVVVVSIFRIMKGAGRISQMGCRFPDSHYLQRLFATDPGAYFKITLECAGGNAIFN